MESKKISKGQFGSHRQANGQNFASGLKTKKKNTHTHTQPFSELLSGDFKEMLKEVG